MSCCSATYWLQHFIAQSQWRLRCAGADVDCDCNCDTWVQTSRLLPPDNALIALQRQPVGDQSSYCSGLVSACLVQRCDTVSVQFFLFAAASWPERSHIPRQSRIELHFFLSALCPCCLTTCCDLLCFPLPLLLLFLILLLLSVLLSCLVGVLFAAAAAPGEWERALHYCRTSLCTWLTWPAVYLSLSRCPSVLLSCVLHPQLVLSLTAVGHFLRIVSAFSYVANNCSSIDFPFSNLLICQLYGMWSTVVALSEVISKRHSRLVH